MFIHQSSSGTRESKKIRGKLSIDTTCAVQHQVFPYECWVPELKFISFSESQARKATSKLQHEEEMPVHPGAEHSVSGLRPNVSVRSQRGAIVVTPSESEQTGSYQKRLLGRKPEPLKLNLQSLPSDSGKTPTIVVAPARDGFRNTRASHVNGRRPASSVYSRYTNCMTTSAAPPVPPLPFTTQTATGLKSRFSTITATTAFEEEFSPLGHLQTSRSDIRSPGAKPTEIVTPGFPTPRRSKGWWNVLSPFSAKSTRPTFWRSPSPALECAPVLQDAAAMGHSESRCGMGIVALSSDAASRPASAPIISQNSMLESCAGVSLTATAVSGKEVQAFDMYHITSTGLAAAYFDVARHFPSLCVQDSDHHWSPSQSAYLATDDSPGTHTESMNTLGAKAMTVDLDETDQEPIHEIKENGRAHDQAASPTPQELKDARVALFSTPSEDELRTPSVPRSKPNRAMTQTTNTSTMTPLSATPKVQQAHLGSSSFGEQKQIAVSRAPSPTAIDEKTASCRHIGHVTGQASPYPASMTRLRPTHTRQDSYGLGIIDGKRDLIPPLTHVEEKPRLDTDRFGQLKVIIAQDEKPTRPWYRRHFWLLAFLSGALLVMLVVMLAVLIPQKHHHAPVQATWLNLTDFPAMAIGVSTIVQPRNAASRNTCTQPALWTCVASVGSSKSALPDFRLEIRFRNDTNPSNETAIQHKKRDAWEEHVYTASPSAPSTDDQLYLGRTTDNTNLPYNGEETPFYISLLNPVVFSTAPKIRKRSSNFSYPYPTGTDSVSGTTKTSAASTILNAAPESKGKSSNSTLYPYVTAQPLRLYNRNQDNEHYGFYTYFERSVYISSSSSTLPGNSTINITANVALEDASALCTFSETRMLVQIWTKQGIIANLTSMADTDTKSKIDAKSSAANDMIAPGSFAYAVTVTLDRHGGDADKKGVYCYALNEHHHVDPNDKGWIWEDRATGGMLLDAAAVPGSATLEERANEHEESGQGIDGGSGGCLCQWKNH